MATPADLKRYRENLRDEIDGATIYRTMAAAEGDPHLATVYRRLADVEERHAAVWEAQLRKAGAKSHRADPRCGRVLLSCSRGASARGSFFRPWPTWSR